MYTSLGLEVAFDCAECHATSAITRVVTEAPCAHCATSVAIDWRSLLTITMRGETIDVLDIARASSGESFASASPSVRARIVVEAPRCGCGAIVPDAVLGKIHFKTTELACEACGVALTARLLRGTEIERARWAIRETPSPSVALASSGRVRHCAGCGAPLESSEGACRFCNATTVPTALAAPRSTHRFYVVVRDEG